MIQPKKALQWLAIAVAVAGAALLRTPDDRPDIDRLQEMYLSEAPQRPPELRESDTFDDLHYKAFVYLQVGPDAYRQMEAFGMPPASWTALELDAVRMGCEQIVRWRGLSPEAPLEGMGIGGFYLLAELFHFTLVGQGVLLDGGPGGTLDAMQMKHSVDGRALTFFNFVKTPTI